MKKVFKNIKVEWKSIEEIFNLKNGYTPSKSKKEYWTNGTIPWFRMEDLRSNGTILDNSIQKVHISGLKGNLFPENSIIMATTATIGEHALITVEHLTNQQFTNFSLKDEYKDKLDIKFVYYYFFIIDEKAKQSVNKSSFPSIQMNELKKWNFPIPPLDIQKKIVKILDKFTELTTELTLRKKQYSYYLNKLLSFDKQMENVKCKMKNESGAVLIAHSEVEWRKLGEVLKRSKGTKITANQMKKLHKENAPVKIFAGGKTFAYVDFDDIPKKDINYNPSIIVKSRGVIEFEYYDKPFSHKNEFWSYYSENDNIDIKFIYYYLKSKEKYFQQIASKMQMPQISIPDTDNFLIPIPSLKKQKEIVAILDKFHTLTNSLTEGLPREIELRKKQYEYYRNLLLDFKKD